MAATLLQDLCEESTCSICLEYFQDPVTIKCGHNFCKACLTQYWKGLWGGKISCPQCRENIQRKFFPNQQLANIVELSRKLRLREEKSPEGKGGVCGKHQEPLKLFCKDDETPICVVCDRAKEHRNHDVVPVEEAAQDYQDLIHTHLGLLEKERSNILAHKAETEEKNQALLKRTKAEMEKMKDQFRELYSLLNKQEKFLLAQLEEVEKETIKKRDDHLARLSEELSSLGGLIREMEEKCRQPPGELLQDVRCILKRCEKKETFQNLVTFPSALNVKISEVCDRNTSLVGLIKQLTDTLVSGPRTSRRQTFRKTLLSKANVTLDPDTAHPRLVLSEDRKRVNCGNKHEDLADNPERFDCWSFVLGSEGFIGGSHSWEVTVGKEEFWAVGVARKSVWRKGNVDLSVEEGIWAIGKWAVWGERSEYRACSHPDQLVLPLSGNQKRIQVSLKCEEGEVAFHDGNTGFHLYTFSGASFSGETLLPFFYVDGRASLTILP